MTSAHSPVLPADCEVDAGGLRTHYLEAGEGDALLLLHGSGPGVSAASNWGGVIDALAEHRRVIAMDFAGFGDSEKTRDGAYDIKLWQRQLLAFLDALELASVPIVGNSFGGAMALAASMRHPDRVERLVLMGTPVGEYPLTDGLRGAREYDGTRKNLREVLERLTYDPSLVTEEMLDRRHASSVVPRAQDALRALIPASVPGSKPTIVKGIPEHHLSSVRAPTLVLHGRDDRVVPFELGLRLLNGIEDSELHAFGRCGHWVQLERRDDFLRLVLEFVGRAR
jgi:2-hydroxy-6-oxo-octa-2,4-dienoate hydrolase